MSNLSPIHPGEVLLHDFLEPLKLSQRQVAQAIGIPPNRINSIVKGTRGVTGDTALRLGKYFNTSANLWINLQAEYDLDKARLERGKEIDKIQPMAL
ncbi:MAG: HigA family addiction module antitoxin [Balneolales bacterium]